MESVHLSYKFFLGDGRLEDVSPKLSTKPDDTWRAGKRHKEDGFSYDRVFKGCRLLDEKELKPFLDHIAEIFGKDYEILPGGTTTVLSIAVYVKDNSGVHIDWHFVSMLEALGTSVDIDVYNVGDLT